MQNWNIKIEIYRPNNADQSIYPLVLFFFSSPLHGNYFYFMGIPFYCRGVETAPHKDKILLFAFTHIKNNWHFFSFIRQTEKKIYMFVL